MFTHSRVKPYIHIYKLTTFLEAGSKAKKAPRSRRGAKRSSSVKATEDASKEATRLAEAEKEAQSAEDDRQVKASTEAFKEVSRLANHVTAQLKLEVKAVNDRRKYNALVAALKSNLTLADDG